MKALLNRIHARVGDLWWYSAMIFIACRSGDVINAFIGLWLVPKYVGPNELGAVLPLQQLTSFLTVPLGVVAIVFAKYVNTYATRGEYGKVKSFIRDVLGISAILFVICIVGAYLIMPYFYERLRIESGLLTVLILASGLVGAIGQLVTSTQQGLKRFETMSFTAIISAPVRLVTMLVAMPIRALSGYLLGQTTPGVVTTACAAYDTHRALKPYTPDPSWRKDWKQILNYTWPIAIFTTFNLVFATITSTIYRQRLPEIESSANYMLSRFAEIAGYVGTSISVILFPLVSESHENGNEDTSLLRKAIIGTAIPSALLVLGFYISADFIFSLTETWAIYRPYANLLPFLILITGSSSVIGTIVSYEMACRRFGIAAFIIFFNILWIAFLVCFTGYEFFRGLIPDVWITFMSNCHIRSLRMIVYASIPSAIIQIIIIKLIFRRRQRQSRSHKSR